MKALEKIENYNSRYSVSVSKEIADKVHEDLRNIVNNLAEIRSSKEKTKDYFDSSIVGYKSNYIGDSEDLALALIDVLADDKLSFSYIYYYLTDWVQGLDYGISIYRCPIQKEIEYAIEFDLDEIDKKVKSAEDPTVIIKKYLGQSGLHISLNFPYKKMVEERLHLLLNNYTATSNYSPSPVVCEFLVRQDHAEEDMKKLHSLFDGKKGKDLAIAVCAAAKSGIISKSPSYAKLKSYFNVQGSDSAYEAYQNQFLDPTRIKSGKDRTTLSSYVDQLKD